MTLSHLEGSFNYIKFKFVIKSMAVTVTWTICTPLLSKDHYNLSKIHIYIRYFKGAPM